MTKRCRRDQERQKDKEQLIEGIIKFAEYHTPWIYTTARLYPERLQPKMKATTFPILPNWWPDTRAKYEGWGNP